MFLNVKRLIQLDKRNLEIIIEINQETFNKFSLIMESRFFLFEVETIEIGV